METEKNDNKKGEKPGFETPGTEGVVENVRETTSTITKETPGDLDILSDKRSNNGLFGNPSGRGRISHDESLETNVWEQGKTGNDARAPSQQIPGTDLSLSGVSRTTRLYFSLFIRRIEHNAKRTEFVGVPRELLTGEHIRFSVNEMDGWGKIFVSRAIVEQIPLKVLTRIARDASERGWAVVQRGTAFGNKIDLSVESMDE